MGVRSLILSTALATSALADDVVLIGIGEHWRFRESDPSIPASEVGWRDPGFDDAQWSAGRSGFSCYNSGLYEATVLPGPSLDRLTWFFRKTFLVQDPGTVTWLVLRADYDDGFVAHLNGVEVARRGFESGLEVRPDTPALPRGRTYAEEIDLSSFTGLLRAGENLLAIEVHRSSLPDLSLALVPELRANFVRGPLIQNSTPHSTCIAWKTPVPADSRVDYGLEPSLGQSAFDPAPSTNHVVALTDLRPGTRYYYRVSSAGAGGTATGPLASFQTLKETGSVTFAVFGDSGSGWGPQYDVAATLIASPSDLVLHTGDVIYPMNEAIRTDARGLSVYAEHMRTTPYYYTFGNHDLYAGDSAYLDAFALPTNSVTATEHFYSFDHGEVHFSCLFIPSRNLDGIYPAYSLWEGSPQLRWLTNDLAATTRPWKVLFFHSPLNTSGPHRLDQAGGVHDRLELQRLILPVAERYGVQLAFSGHDHAYERFAPLGGVHQIVSGGGGYPLYPLYQWDPATVRYVAAYHHVRVTADPTRLQLNAIDTAGNVFDSMIVHRLPPDRRIHDATGHLPVLPAGPADDTDGNVSGQRFDLLGAPLPTLSGRSANLGEVWVNNDGERLYVGIGPAMFGPDRTVLLFLESPRLPGVSNLAGLGDGLGDEAGQGADGLDFLEHLAFTNFTPALGCILGDELADSQQRRFRRPGLPPGFGQGVFRLDSELSDVPGIWLQQFNSSPQVGVNPNEQDADFIVVAVPFTELGGVQPGEIIRLGAVVAGGGTDTHRPPGAVELDTAFFGSGFQGGGLTPSVLEGVAVRLAPDPDPDRDGLSRETELRLGTDPEDADSDHDGLPDGWEVACGLDPRSDEGRDGADGDPDGDGLTNAEEWRSGNDPNNPLSVLRLEVSVLGDQSIRLSWSAVPGKVYELECADAGSLRFSNLDPHVFPRPAATALERYTNGWEAPPPEARFYRVRLVP